MANGGGDCTSQAALTQQQRRRLARSTDAFCGIDCVCVLDIAPSFQMYDIPSVPESHGKLYAWHGSTENYTTAVVGNMSMAFIRKSVAEQKPFMACTYTTHHATVAAAAAAAAAAAP